MDQAWEAYVWNVSRAAKDSFEIPDSFRTARNNAKSVIKIQKGEQFLRRRQPLRRGHLLIVKGKADHLTHLDIFRPEILLHFLYQKRL